MKPRETQQASWFWKIFFLLCQVFGSHGSVGLWRWWIADALLDVANGLKAKMSWALMRDGGCHQGSPPEKTEMRKMLHRNARFHAFHWDLDEFFKRPCGKWPSAPRSQIFLKKDRNTQKQQDRGMHWTDLNCRVFASWGSHQSLFIGLFRAKNSEVSGRCPWPRKGHGFCNSFICFHVISCPGDCQASCGQGRLGERFQSGYFFLEPQFEGPTVISTSLIFLQRQVWAPHSVSADVDKRA